MSEPQEQPADRPAARVLVKGPNDRILLFWAELGRSVDPARRPEATGFWALPGGGVEPGESYAVAAARELKEETGIDAVRPLVELDATRDIVHPPGLIGLVRDILGGCVPATPVVLSA